MEHCYIGGRRASQCVFNNGFICRPSERMCKIKRIKRIIENYSILVFACRTLERKKNIIPTVVLALRQPCSFQHTSFIVYGFILENENVRLDENYTDFKTLSTFRQLIIFSYSHIYIFIFYSILVAV